MDSSAPDADDLRVIAVPVQMLCSSSRVLQRCCFALFLLCSPVPLSGRPVDALSSRIKRSVTHAQLMHDKGRTLQDFKRRMWLQDLLDEVHTAEIRDLPVRTTGAGGSSSGAGVGLPGVSLGINLSTTGSTLHSKPPEDQEPPHHLQAGGGGGHQPAAGDQQVSDVQRWCPQSARQEEEEREVREEEGGREEEEEGAFSRCEAGGRSRERTPPGVEVSARPAEGAALKRCQSLTKEPANSRSRLLNTHLTLVCHGDYLERNWKIFIVCKYSKYSRIDSRI
ncbi:hypothetical protein INR49_008095 [Caranx melampygus]|nr:hypothetical protein INR49_008095 [Caranx melampygus]